MQNGSNYECSVRLESLIKAISKGHGFVQSALAEQAQEI